MTRTNPTGLWAILLSLGIALFLTVLPMPDSAEDFRPQWVAMTVIFWALAAPERFGVFSAFTAGLILDIATGTVLGQHALGLSVVAFVAAELHRRIVVFPVWQQAVFVWMLLLVKRLLSLWVLGATGQPTPTLTYWIPTFLGLVLWPWLNAVLRDLGRRAGMF